MALNLATLNVRELRDQSKCAHLLGELKNISVVQETHLICNADCYVLESDFDIFSAYDSRTSDGVSLLVGRSLDADVDVVFAGDGSRLVEAGCDLCTEFLCGEGFLFPSAGAVPGRFEAASLNG